MEVHDVFLHLDGVIKFSPIRIVDHLISFTSRFEVSDQLQQQSQFADDELSAMLEYNVKLEALLVI
jgi:hypothetical protein